MGIIFINLGGKRQLPPRIVGFVNGEKSWVTAYIHHSLFLIVVVIQ